jgi:branched-subunit amino acid ABC-type transport system permease component
MIVVVAGLGNLAGVIWAALGLGIAEASPVFSSGRNIRSPSSLPFSSPSSCSAIGG